MEKTLHHLQRLYYLSLAAAALVAVLFETELLPVGILCGVGGMAPEFVATMGLELLTLAAVPLALWLFRAKKIRSALTSLTLSAAARTLSLRRYGTWRIVLMVVPLFLNLLLYYLFLCSAGLYLALIALVASIFIMPTARRCAAETTPGEKTS